MATDYDIDFVHSELGFSVVHLMITRVHGVFTKWSGTFVIDHANPAASRLSVEIDASSVDTRNAQRDGHLRSPDFFDVAKFPTIRFEGKQLAAKGDAFELSGDFSLRGVTRPLTFTVTGGRQARDSQGRARVGYRATATISRGEFGVAWNAVYEGGSIVVGDEVTLVLDLQLIPRG
jgi:polyisoprenoid-binding protein YceI